MFESDKIYMESYVRILTLDHLLDQKVRNLLDDAHYSYTSYLTYISFIEELVQESNMLMAVLDNKLIFGYLLFSGCRHSNLLRPV